MRISNNLNSSVNQNFGMALKIKPQAKRFLKDARMSEINSIGEVGKKAAKWYLHIWYNYTDNFFWL